MQQQQQPLTWKDKINAVYNICDIHQRGVVIPLREGMGPNFLGIKCLIAFVLMLIWAAVSQDTLMFYWLVLWTFCYLWRAFEANKLRGLIHSYSDGRCIGLGSNDRLAKGLWEPLLVGLSAVLLRGWYIETGWNPSGLPNFLLLGFVTLIVVQKANVMMYERKLDAIGDAKMENEDLVNEYRNRYGERR
jgi:hypothetical protein